MWVPGSGPKGPSAPANHNSVTSSWAWPVAQLYDTAYVMETLDRMRHIAGHLTVDRFVAAHDGLYALGSFPGP